MKIPRVIIDTNVLISGLIIPKGSPFQVLRLWQAKKFELLVSSNLIAETSEVLRRPKILKKYNLSLELIEGFLQLIHLYGIIVFPTKSKVEVRDDKDQDILDTAISGKADFLVTGDDDLLVLASDTKVGKLNILTPREFVEKMNK
ncbi:MAG: putative toxin-antitoxin system toxin component, PIN family [Candidatus Pacebacteria bacterium CG_4_10_14_0_8_um_filter_42_14]|nr:MAG: putative toxin-antitoxin system toxin component, PIN family [Candidatus Pacebacteria bacterium CG_4_10_14_0_8_um_filter_42_14]